MRSNIKKERVQLTTVQVFSKSVPSQLFLVLGRPCRNAHVVVLPRLPFAHIRRALAFTLAVRFA